MIRDINSQIEKAVFEIEMRYSKGMKFQLSDLLSVSSCDKESNFSIFRNSLKTRLINGRIAQIHSTRNGTNIFIKL